MSYYFLTVFSSYKLLKARPMSPLPALLLTTLQAAWWLQASHCQAPPPVALFLSQSSWLQSVVFQSPTPIPPSLKFLCWNLWLCCFLIPPCKLSAVVSKRAGIETELVSLTLLFGKKVHIKEVAIKNILCFANNSWIGLSAIAVLSNRKWHFQRLTLNVLGNRGGTCVW